MKLHFDAGRHFFEDHLILTGKHVLIEGDGPGATELVVSPGASIQIRQREHATGSSLILRDLSIVIDGDRDTDIAPLQLQGPGTENMAQVQVRIQNVQFGHQDARPTHHPVNPGPLQALPKTWVTLDGVYGYVFDQCSFAGQERGAHEYPVEAAVSIIATGFIEDIDGTMYPPRSMRGEFRSCHWRPGIWDCIWVLPDAWVEGIIIESCRATGAWRLINVMSNAQNAAKGTFLTLTRNHVAFNREGVRIAAGAGIEIAGNYFMPLPHGEFEDSISSSAHVALGMEGKPFGTVLCNVHHNVFGMTDPTNKPMYGVSVRGTSSRIYIDRNHYQVCRPVWCGDSVRDIWLDGEKVEGRT